MHKTKSTQSDTHNLCNFLCNFQVLAEKIKMAAISAISAILAISIGLSISLSISLMIGKAAQAGFINETTNKTASADDTQAAHATHASFPIATRALKIMPNHSTYATHSALAPKSAAMRWEIQASDITLRQTLMRWAINANWQVSWEIQYDYPVQLESSFFGTFKDAIEQFTQALRYSDYPILACLYEANHVVRILHYGESVCHRATQPDAHSAAHIFSLPNHTARYG